MEQAQHRINPTGRQAIPDEGEYLDLLGISREIRKFSASERNSFDYGDSRELISPGCHLIPSSKNVWMAGESNSARLLVCRSAMDGLAFLSLRRERYSLRGLSVIALGNNISASQISYIQKKFKRSKITLLFENGLTGHAADVFVACRLRSSPVKLAWTGSQVLAVYRRNKIFFDEALFSLSTFQQAFSIRTGIRTQKSLKHSSFYEQLRHDLIERY